jgi:hypothetical protein
MLLRKTLAAAHNNRFSNPDYKVITERLDTLFEQKDKNIILTHTDISGFPKLKALVESPSERRVELTSKLSENGRKTFDKEMTSGKVAQLEKKTIESREEHKKHLETAKKVTEIQESLEPFLEKVEELRGDLEAAVAKGEKEISQSTRSKVDGLIKELASANKEFSGLSSASFKSDVKGYREDFEKLVRFASDKQQVLTDLEKEEEPVEVRNLRINLEASI